jgi:activator of HSP90 ATPase
MKSGIGSVWNQGSWHWEEKNYNKWAKEELIKRLQEVKVECGGFVIEIPKCIVLEGEVNF